MCAQACIIAFMPAHKTLSEQASKGGLARAKSLDPADRSEIARRAAETRWGASGQLSLLPKETHEGSIKVGGREIPCSVLDNGVRVFSTRGINRAMGSRKTGKPESGAPQLPAFLAAASLKPFISDELAVRLVSPLQYRPKHGGRTAFGYEAMLLPSICEVILDANKAGNLKKNQEHLAEMAEVLLRGFARVGVIALVDEATGYQEERARDELARILEAYVMEQYRPWTRRFPEEFFRQIYRLHNWPYKPGNAKRTPFIGKLINKYIYEPLPTGVLDELRRVNPVTEGGWRKRKHFQHLADTGNEHLDRQITSVITLMRVSDSKDHLEHNFAKAFDRPPVAIQTRLPIDVEQASEVPSSWPKPKRPVGK
jgi:P63C domain-containing protein